MQDKRSFIIDKAPGKELIQIIIETKSLASLHEFFDLRLNWHDSSPLVHDRLITYGIFTDLEIAIKRAKGFSPVLIDRAITLAKGQTERQFLCAIFLFSLHWQAKRLLHLPCALGIDGCNLQAGNVLAMTLAHANALLGAILEDHDLVALVLTRDLGSDACALYHRLTDTYCATIRDEQDVVNGDRIAHSAAKTLYFHRVASGHAVLLSTCANDCVHRTFSFLTAPAAGLNSFGETSGAALHPKGRDGRICFNMPMRPGKILQSTKRQYSRWWGFRQT